MSRKSKSPTTSKAQPATNPAATPRPGRPPGKRNAEYDEVEATPVACRRCGSTERSKYSGRRELQYSGERDGRPYTRIVWRSCCCLQCGQHRREKSFETDPE